MLCKVNYSIWTVVPPFDVEKKRVFRFGVGIPNWSSSCTLPSLVPGFNLLPLKASIKDVTCPLVLVSTRLLLQYIGKRFLLFRKIFVPSIDIRTTCRKRAHAKKSTRARQNLNLFLISTRHLLPSMQLMQQYYQLETIENTKQ